MTEDEVKDKVKKLRTIAVSLIRSTKDSILVEWKDKEGKLQRGYIPVSSYNNGNVLADELELSIPYGIPWEKHIGTRGTPEEIANKLRSAGIWTKEDLFANTQAAIGAIQSVIGLHLGALLEAAEKHDES
jgi:hypothetical protein